MTVVSDFKSASNLSKVAFVLLAIASVFSTISFATTSWGSGTPVVGTTVTYYGLWKVCDDTNNNQVTSCTDITGTVTDWYAAVQALVLFGFCGTLVSLLMVTLFLFVHKCKTNGQLGLGAGIICIVTGLLYLIGCIVFGTQWNKYYSDNVAIDYSLEYGFALSVVGLVLELLAGIILLAETRRATRGPP